MGNTSGQQSPNSCQLSTNTCEEIVAKAGVQQPQVVFHFVRVADIEVSLLKSKTARLESDLQRNGFKFHFNFINDSDENVMNHTGLPNEKFFNAVIDLMKDNEMIYHFNWKVEKISKENQLLLTLRKLRMNLKTFDLCQRFDCSNAMVTNITKTWIVALHQILFVLLMSEILSKEKNVACLPKSFKDILVAVPL